MNVGQLTCENMTKDYGKRFALGPLSLTVSSGVTCLVGANGTGKSTFFRLAAGVDRPTSGSIRLNSGTGRSGLGYLPQDPTLPTGATCHDFLHYVAWLQRIPKTGRADAVSKALAQVGLTDRSSVKIRTLSGGMQRRLGIAHALVHDPGLLLLDEPTVGLDPTQRIALRETIRQVSHSRIVIVSTHLIEDVRGLADRVIVLHDGDIVFDGSVPDLEKLATPDAPGDTDLERAIAKLMRASR